MVKLKRRSDDIEVERLQYFFENPKKIILLCITRSRGSGIMGNALGPEWRDDNGDDDYDDDDNDGGKTRCTMKRRRFSMITGENNIADNVHVAAVV